MIAHPKIKIVIAKYPYDWDGSYLGTFTDEIIGCQTLHDDIEYTRLTIKGFKTFCIMRKYLRDDGKLCCIFDELKPLFGVTKTGTHHLHIGKSFYVIYKTATNSGNMMIDHMIYPELLENNEYIEPNIRKLLAFRDLAGVSPNNDRYIRLRKTESGYLYPISLNDKFILNMSMSLSKEHKQPLSKTTIDKWFKNIKVSEVVATFVNVKFGDKIKPDDIGELICPIRYKMESTIERIDKNYIFLSHHIFERFTSKIVDNIE